MSLCSCTGLKHFNPRAYVHAADNHLLKQNISHDHAASLGLMGWGQWHIHLLRVSINNSRRASRFCAPCTHRIAARGNSIQNMNSCGIRGTRIPAWGQWKLQRNRNRLGFYYKSLYNYTYLVSWGNSIGIATGCGLDDRGVGVRVPAGSRFLSSPRRPVRVWGPHSLLSKGDGGGALSPEGWG
jgi:hypothetical protein